ncbi:polyphosphate kinase [Arthrobacter sp. Hiyo1]|nr:polyphosphate kinase [Arthrobacter sp. Hiyo1]
MPPRFGSSEVPAARATQDRIDIPEFAPSLEPEGDISPDRFLDRELSWLAFNSRVLELAEDPDLFLLERVNFLSIFASNLDEFFMVRVAGLKRRIATGLAVPSPAGLSPIEVLEQIGDAARKLQERHARVFAEQIRPALAYEHIHLMRWDELDDEAQHRLSIMFGEKVFPILTPLAVDPAHPFPYISGLSLNLAVIVRNPVSDKELFARVKVPDQLPRLVSIDGPRAGAVPGRVARFIALEEVIAVHLDKLFPGMEVMEHHTFRVTRNEDVEVEEDDARTSCRRLKKNCCAAASARPSGLRSPRTSTRTSARSWCGNSASRNPRSTPFRLPWTSGACRSSAELTAPTSTTRSTCPTPRGT